MTSARAEMKDALILAAMQRWGGSWTTRQVADRIKEEEEELRGPGPALLTGRIYIAPWQVYFCLVRLREAGKVKSRHATPRTIFWRAT